MLACSTSLKELSLRAWRTLPTVAIFRHLRKTSLDFGYDSEHPELTAAMGHAHIVRGVYSRAKIKKWDIGIVEY